MKSGIRRGMAALVSIATIIILIMVWSYRLTDTQTVSLVFALLAVLLAAVPPWTVGNQAESGFVAQPARVVASGLVLVQMVVGALFIFVMEDAAKLAASIHTVFMIIAVLVIARLLSQARTIVESTGHQRFDASVITGGADRLALCADQVSDTQVRRAIIEAEEALRYAPTNGNAATRDLELAIQCAIASIEGAQLAKTPETIPDSARFVVSLVKQRELRLRAAR